jgi:hyperosmotically inducible protein
MLRKLVLAGGAFALLAMMPVFAADKTTGETIDDSTIATKTKTALLADKKAPGSAINVEVYKGQVLLAGFVGSDEEKAAAIAVAEKESGVVKVIDGMVVVAGKRSFGQTVDDQTIQTKLKSNLVADKAMDGKGFNVNTEVSHGEVLMSGFVADEKFRTRAGEIAQAISGVKAVHNNIWLKSE